MSDYFPPIEPLVEHAPRAPCNAVEKTQSNTSNGAYLFCLMVIIAMSLIQRIRTSS